MTQVTLVCGSGGALGSSLVETMLTRGDDVVAVDRTPGGDVQPRLQHETVDLTSADEVNALWERLAAAGRTPRWVVNAVGGFRPGTVADSDPASLRFMEDLNLGTAWWSCAAAARHLVGGGAVVNIASRTAVAGGVGSAPYAVAKAGVVHLTEVIAGEVAERRIRVNAVLPSVIDTPANRASMTAEQMQGAVAPHDIASVVSFLLSDAAAAVTGAIIPVYGFA
ncbi:MAG: SDR family oxidoreductase [Actinomycetes bacterium]